LRAILTDKQFQLFANLAFEKTANELLEIIFYDNIGYCYNNVFQLITECRGKGIPITMKRRAWEDSVFYVEKFPKSIMINEINKKSHKYEVEYD